jgi:hydrogenase nickel incorporation protein HypA/HybF
MHELSIALSIVDIAEEEVRKAGAQQVDRIELDIGNLSGVEIDALEFIWNEAVRSSVLEKAERLINKIPGKAKCMECSEEFEMKQLFDACPRCHQYFNDILQGKELKVKSLTVT